MSKEFSYSDVQAHSHKKDLYMVIHDKVYDCSSFVDEHPGGEEVMLDVGGQEATEAFEDVGHSDEAREILDGMLVGTLKRGENDPPPTTTKKSKAAPPPGSSSGGFGAGLYVLILVGGIAAFGVYQYLEQQKQK